MGAHNINCDMRTAVLSSMKRHLPFNAAHRIFINHHWDTDVLAARHIVFVMVISVGLRSALILHSCSGQYLRRERRMTAAWHDMAYVLECQNQKSFIRQMNNISARAHNFCALISYRALKSKRVARSRTRAHILLRKIKARTKASVCLVLPYQARTESILLKAGRIYAKKRIMNRNRA